MAKKAYIKNKKGTIVYPISVESAILDSSGNTLDQKLENLPNYPTRNEVDETISNEVEGYMDTIDVSVDPNTGTPAVNAELRDGILHLQFFNLKGKIGDRGPVGVESIEINIGQGSGTPTGTATVSNGVLHISLNNLKGEQGNPGSSQAYPFELENTRFGGGTSKAWTAEQGKILSQDVLYLGTVIETL